MKNLISATYMGKSAEIDSERHRFSNFSLDKSYVSYFFISPSMRASRCSTATS